MHITVGKFDRLDESFVSFECSLRDGFQWFGRFCRRLVVEPVLTAIQNPRTQTYLLPSSSSFLVLQAAFSTQSILLGFILELDSQHEPSRTPLQVPRTCQWQQQWRRSRNCIWQLAHQFRASHCPSLRHCEQPSRQSLTGQV